MSEERTVSLGEVGLEDAQRQVEEESRSREVTMAGIAQAVPSFTKVKDFTTFEAEYAWVNGDLIIHFFVTKEMKQLNKTEEGGPIIIQYWTRTFPLALDRTSKEFFQADSPRLQAKYTEELASWYFRAQGYGDRLDPDRFAETFFEQLDQDLESQRIQDPGQ